MKYNKDKGKHAIYRFEGDLLFLNNNSRFKKLLKELEYDINQESIDEDTKLLHIINEELDKANKLLRELLVKASSYDDDCVSFSHMIGLTPPEFLSRVAKHLEKWDPEVEE